MNKLFKILFLFLTVSCTTISFAKNDDNSPEPTPVVVVMEDDDDITEIVFKFEAGDYTISWEGSPFKTTLTKTDENTLTGRFCLNNDLSNCEDIGPITIVRNENTVTFQFSDIVCKISEDVPGEFNGTGNITNDNTYSFLVSGEDCKRTYTDNRVILTKL